MTTELAEPTPELEPPIGEAQGWRALLALEGEPTSDGRIFEHATWRTLPLPLSWQVENWEGHSGSTVVGRIDAIVRRGSELWGSGIIDLGQDAGRELVRQLGLRLVRGISIDAAIGDGEVIRDDDGTTRMTSIEIGGATVVSFPAFARAEIELIAAEEAASLEELDVSAHLDMALELAASGSTSLPLADKGRSWDGPGAASRVKSWAGGVNARYGQAFFVVDGPADQAGSYHLGFADVIDGRLTAVPRGIIAAAGAVQGARGASNPAFQAAKPRIAAYYRRMDMTPPWQSASPLEVVTAAGSPWRPPRAWFEPPNLARRSGLHVEDSGRVYGHIYGWGECHAGSPEGQCIRPPRGAEYRYITGVDGRGVVCDDGELVATGPLVLNADHAATSGLSWLAAKDHYAHTGLAVADVTCGEDAHGIWVAGALRPGLDSDVVHTLRASAPSGDWRPIAGRLELIAILAVNMPGFPALVASVSGGEVTALVVRSAYGTDCGCGGEHATDELLERLSVLEEVVYRPVREERERAVQAALAEMGNDPTSRGRRVLAEIG